MKKVYILLMQSWSIPSRVIKVLTRYQYSHVALALEEDCYTTYSFGRLKTHNFLVGGFAVEKQDGPFFSYFDNTGCRIYELSVTDEQYENISNRIERMLENKSDYGYDYFGVFMNWFGIPPKFRNRYVCSSFVAEVLNESGAYNFNKNTALAKPRDFLEIPYDRMVYEGLYRDYKMI